MYWIDLEMTGLDPDTCTIIEIASIITDGELNLISEGPSLVIHQPKAALEAMDDWNQKHHKQSGLYDLVLESHVTLADAELQTLEFIKSYLPVKRIPVCGNSVWQDRRFLNRYMPLLDNYFHYRNVDVSSVKELLKRWYPGKSFYQKEDKNHRALEDVRNSISELKSYRENFFIPFDLPSDD